MKKLTLMGCAMLLCIVTALAAGLAAAEGAAPGVQVCVFADSNRNGERGQYENGLAGVQVTLLMDGSVAAQAQTGADGMAQFAGVAPGAYTLRTQLPDAWGYAKTGAAKKKINLLHINVMNQSSEPVQEYAFQVDSEDVAMGVAAIRLSGVGGRVWIDENDDGVMQDEEPGYEGLAIQITGAKNGVNMTVYSAADGTYLADRLTPGAYELKVTLPDGLTYAKYVKTGGNRRSIFSSEGKATRKKDVTLTEGDVDKMQNIGVLSGSVVRGVCFLDANYNGFYDEGEPLLKGVKIEVIKQMKGDVSGKTTSNAQGEFVVDGLRASTYKVRAVLPEGYFFTMVPGAHGGNQFKAMPGRRENTIQNITLGVGGELVLAIGAVKPGTVTGVCYEDDDFSGQKNGKEKVVSGLNVTLLDASGRVVAEDKTNVKGKYEFTGLVPGTYTVALNAKNGYAFTKAGEGNVILNSGSGRGVSEPFFLALGETLNGMDCGMILPGTVKGVLFADANDNGVQDEGEAGLAGARVTLVEETMGEVFAATLGADGAYVFDAVMPGRYFVRYTLPEETEFARAPASDNVTIAQEGVAETGWFKFAMADDVTMPVCGALTLSHVRGMAYHDANVNGMQDAGEEPVAGVTVTLTPARSGAEAIVCTTGADGAYALEGLRPDQYTLAISFPDGKVLSSAEGLALPLSAGSRGDAVTMDLPMGTALNDQDLGTVVGASVAGRLWMDANNDGVMNVGEPGLSGQTVTVIDDRTGDVFAVLTTDADGEFRTGAISMVPGSYSLTYALPDNGRGAVSGDSDLTNEGGALVLRGLTVGEGESRTGLRAGVVLYTKIEGHVWVDRGSSVEMLPGAEVALLDNSGAQLAHTTSDENGAYAFGGLLPGEYALSVELPAGQVVVEPDDDRLTIGGMKSVMRACKGRGAVSDLFALSMAEDLNDMDIGAVLPARVGDLAWLDVNGNGLQDSGEYGVPNVTVSLMRDGQEIARTETDQYGFYYFGDVYPAAYTLRVAAPAEVKPTVIRDDFTGICSILQDSGETLPFTVSSGVRFYNADLGFVMTVQGAYPAWYGKGATQNWTKLGSAE